ncbi:MAG: hypothetical protein LBN22_06870 [Clostridiales Family XIII bacterium]|jgi:hypothetical protein|nr:hypothetical protein [Clostridiales Family XIII bacterium]
MSEDIKCKTVRYKIDIDLYKHEALMLQENKCEYLADYQLSMDVSDETSVSIVYDTSRFEELYLHSFKSVDEVFHMLEKLIRTLCKLDNYLIRDTIIDYNPHHIYIEKASGRIYLILASSSDRTDNLISLINRFGLIRSIPGIQIAIANILDTIESQQLSLQSLLLTLEKMNHRRMIVS